MRHLRIFTEIAEDKILCQIGTKWYHVLPIGDHSQNSSWRDAEVFNPYSDEVAIDISGGGRFWNFVSRIINFCGLNVDFINADVRSQLSSCGGTSIFDETRSRPPQKQCSESQNECESRDSYRSGCGDGLRFPINGGEPSNGAVKHAFPVRPAVVGLVVGVFLSIVAFMLAWVVFDLAGENVADQLSELDGVAWAGKAFVCCHALEYGMKAGTFKGRVKRPEFQTGPLPFFPQSFPPRPISGAWSRVPLGGPDRVIAHESEAIHDLSACRIASSLRPMTTPRDRDPHGQPTRIARKQKLTSLLTLRLERIDRRR
jgi:hypothetical protein